MARFRTGDIFSFPLPNGEYLSGRILLDVKQQCVRPKRLKPDSPLGFFSNTLLLETYTRTSSTPSAAPSEVLIPGVFMDAGSLQSGLWEIVGHQEVDPTTVEFPESLLNLGPHPHFVRGEILLPLGLTSGDLARINVYRTIEPSSMLGEKCAYYLERLSSPESAALPPGDIRSLAGSDLRFSEYRDEVYQALGQDKDQSYYEMSTRLGHDIGRFYG